VLSLEFSLPAELRATPPTLEFRWNGQTLERFVASTSTMKRRFLVRSQNGTNELRIVTSATVVPATRSGSLDTRELGLQLEKLSWLPAR